MKEARGGGAAASIRSALYLHACDGRKPSPSQRLRSAHGSPRDSDGLGDVEEGKGGSQHPGVEPERPGLWDGQSRVEVWSVKAVCGTPGQGPSNQACGMGSVEWVWSVKAARSTPGLEPSGAWPQPHLEPLTQVLWVGEVLGLVLPIPAVQAVRTVLAKLLIPGKNKCRKE